MKEEDWIGNTCLYLLWVILCLYPPRNERAKSLPELINKSDLDGNFFCIIWDKDILFHAGDLPPGREHHQSTSRNENAWSMRGALEIVLKLDMEMAMSMNLLKS